MKAPLRNLLSLFCQEGGLFQPKSVTVISYYSSFISIMVLSATTLGVGWRPGSAWRAPSGVEVDDPGHHVDCPSYILLGVDFSDVCHIDGHLPPWPCGCVGAHKEAGEGRAVAGGSMSISVLHRVRAPYGPTESGNTGWVAPLLLPGGTARGPIHGAGGTALPFREVWGPARPCHSRLRASRLAWSVK